MREGGQILKDIIAKLAAAVKPGITTHDLDALANELVASYKVKPAFLNYGGFPATLCTSVNDEVVHGVPSQKLLKKGDIISLDMGIIYHGFNLDSAITLPVLGDISYEEWSRLNPQLHKLIRITEESLNLGIKQACIGNRIGAIGSAVQKFVEKAGLNVVRDLVGHGIGHRLHEEPHVPNYGKISDGPVLEDGMVIAIEPIVVVGDWHLKIGNDGFTYETKDHSWAAHFEHTIAITADGPLVLT